MPTDREKNRFSARAARYARVGANVERRGGALCRTAHARRRAQSRLGRERAVVGARPAQGPADEGRAVDGDHSRSVAAGIRRRIGEAAERGAADGLGFRQAPHDGGARRRLGEEIRKLRASAGRGGLARPGASRAFARRRPARLQAAISRHAIRRRGRFAATRMAVGDPPAVRHRDRHLRDRQGNRRARARRARLPPRGQARRALP